MKTIINLKALLIFLSLVALLLGSCKAEDKLGSVTQDSQISGGSVSNRINTSLPIWNRGTHFIPQEYWGDYDLFQDEHSVVYRATVTHANIDFYYIVHYGDSYSSYLKTNITLNINVFDKNTASYSGNNTWTRVSLISNSPFTSVVIIKLERNEKGQRVLSYNYKDDIGNGNKYTSPYIHEDDINK